MATQDWRNLRLWMELDGRKDAASETVKTFLNAEMPKIETVLGKAATGSPDFTLHDDRHAYRVAARMVEIIPAEVLPKLTGYELGLLLLSAYLHDVGMTPDAARVRSHYEYLLFGDTDRPAADPRLTDEERARFQEYLDDHMDAVEPPMADNGSVDAATLRRASFIVAHYGRYRHNDWSEDWIRDHLDGAAIYPNWIDDVVTVCRSHHEGYDRLVDKAFLPARRGSHAAVVHLRYLACVLRIADILEFDPERTPRVVFEHRAVSPESAIYWHKDHSVAFTIHSDGSLRLEADPPDAKTHRAIEMMADEIEAELRLCRRIDDEEPFNFYRGNPEPLPHSWRLDGSMQREIRPKNDAYVYIDGAFRPDTQRLLDLLGGVELYGDPLVAVRELIQNAMDAVKEQIASLRLREPDPADPELAERYGLQHWIRLSLDSDDEGRLWLTCQDNGVGMTRTIIERYLLVSGKAVRHQIVDLERRCRAAGFELERTGRFGIGVLSYFMLADRIEITTRRSLEAGGVERHGWSFETEGAGDFGELRRFAVDGHGTTIRLRLTERWRTEGAHDLASQLVQKLKEWLIYLPCRVRFTGPAVDGGSIEWKAGWARDEALLTEMLLAQLDSDASTDDQWTMFSREKQESLQEDAQFNATLRSVAAKGLRWRIWEGPTSEQPFRYRFALPYFELEQGQCTLLVLEDSEGDPTLLKPIGQRPNLIAHKFDGQVRLGTCGITVSQATLKDLRYASSPALLRPIGQVMAAGFMDIDLHSNGLESLSITRDDLGLQDGQAHTSLEVAADAVQSHLDAFLLEVESSVFATLNSLDLKRSIPTGSPLFWLDASNHWAKINSPVVGPVEDVLAKVPLWRGEKAVFGRDLSYRNQRQLHSLFLGRIPNIDTTVAYVASPQPTLTVIWFKDKKPRKANDEHENEYHGRRAVMPPMWSDVVAVDFKYYLGTYFNPHHPVNMRIDRDAFRCVYRWITDSTDPLEHKEKILGSHRFARTFLRTYAVLPSVDVISHRDFQWFDIWNGLAERAPQFLSNLFEKISPERGQEIGHAKIITTFDRESYTYCFSPTGVTLLRGHEFPLPVPSEDWIVTFGEDAQSEA